MRNDNQDKLSIKDINRIFSISPKKAEYYEKHGIITTVRNPQNNYRYFSWHNICEIIRARMYRSLDISVKDTSSIMEASDLAMIDALFESKIVVFEEQIKHSALVLEVLRSRHDRIKRIQDGGINNFEIIEHEPIYYSLIKATDYHPDVVVPNLKRWLEVPEFSEACISYKHIEETNNYDISLGMCMDQRYYEETLKDELSDRIFFDLRHALYTVMLVNEEDISNPSVIDPILEYAESRGIQLAQEIFCRTFLILKGEKGHHKCYFEFFAQIDTI